MLTITDHLPDGLLHVGARDLYRVLDGPTLLCLPGRRAAPLFVSVLLHGNEDTGLGAVQAVLRRHARRGLPRSLAILFGNVAAAREGLRHRDGEPDFNRIWPGAETDGLAEHAMAHAVVAEIAARGPFAAIDIHNNTGLNPRYACVNRLDAPFLQLAILFSRIVVYFTRPLGVLTAAFAPLCPSVAVECGKPGNAAAEAHAAELIDACLHLDHFPVHAIAPRDIDLYHTLGIVRIPVDVRFGFEHNGVDLRLETDLDRLNFQDLPAGTPIGYAPAGRAIPLEVRDESGALVTEQYFEVRAGVIRTRRAVMPAMLTLDERVIRQDCLCYLMERLRTE
ncbi:MAG: M14 family metallopeptidase [Burkholderiales bacterium]